MRAFLRAVAVVRRQRAAFRAGVESVPQWQGAAAARAFQAADPAGHQRRWLGAVAGPVCQEGVAAAWRPRACRVAAVTALQ